MRLAPLVCVALSSSACNEGALSFIEEPRSCEELGEVCPAIAPMLLELADVDHDGAADAITAGLGGTLLVAMTNDNGHTSTSVDVGWGSKLSRCSSAPGIDDLVLYQSLDAWWLWRLNDGRLEVVDTGLPTLGAVVDCIDLGSGQATIVELAGASLRLPAITFEVQPAQTAFSALASLPTAEGSTFGLVASMQYLPDIYVASFDLELGEIVSETTWSFSPGQVEAMEVVGADLVLASLVGADEGELIIARDAEPTSPTAPEAERLQLPWRPAFVRAAQLDDDLDFELVVAPNPISAVAIFGLPGSVGGLELRALELEGIDIAAGDRDGDGRDEIYVLDPRDERIVRIIW